MDRTDENIVRCENCGQTLIAEEVGSHKCSGKGLTQLRQIPIQYYFEMKSNDGNPVLYARTLNDVVLWLEVVPTSHLADESDFVPTAQERRTARQVASVAPNGVLQATQPNKDLTPLSWKRLKRNSYFAR
jgi:hypothetical protein